MGSFNFPDINGDYHTADTNSSRKILITNLISSYEKFTHLVDKGKIVDMFFFYFQKAFGTVSYSILLDKCTAKHVYNMMDKQLPKHLRSMMDKKLAERLG